MRSITQLLAITAGLAAYVSADGPSMSPPTNHSSTAPKIEKLQPQFSDKYQRVRVTYGTYTLAPLDAAPASDSNATGMADMPTMGGASAPHAPPSTAPAVGSDMSGMDMRGTPPRDMRKRQMDMDKPMGGMMDEGGLLDATNPSAPLPCTDCTLKWAKAALTFPDGSTANFATGAILHHLTLSVVGPGRSDLMCPGGTMRIPANMERILAIHNDRNETFFGMNGLDEMGYYLSSQDTMHLELMLQNQVNVPKDVVFSIEWEFAPGKQENWADVRGIWMDAAPCSAMMSDIEAPANETMFTLTGPVWKSSVDGQLLTTVGHGHDELVKVEILNGGKPICESEATYGGKPEYVPTQEVLRLGAADMKHISSVSPCLSLGRVRKGDKLQLRASYDFETNKPDHNTKGELSDVMGVAMMFVKVEGKVGYEGGAAKGSCTRRRNRKVRISV